MFAKKTATATDNDQVSKLEEQIQQLQQELTQAKEADLRSKADYHNIVRRSQEERAKLIKLSTQELLSELLEPLDNLSRAAVLLNDQGLNMTMQQFWHRLQDFGLTEIDVMGKSFDVRTMEVVEKKGEGEKVIEVVKKGYQLNGEVLQHAKVIVG